MIDADQLRRLNTLLREIGVTTREDARAAVVSRVDRAVRSAGDLTAEEADAVLGWLDEKAAEIAAQREPDDEYDPEAGDADDER